jgi:hypothetical protein
VIGTAAIQLTTPPPPPGRLGTTREQRSKEIAIRLSLVLLSGSCQSRETPGETAVVEVARFDGVVGAELPPCVVQL